MVIVKRKIHLVMDLLFIDVGDRCLEKIDNFFYADQRLPLSLFAVSPKLISLLHFRSPQEGTPSINGAMISPFGSTRYKRVIR